MQSTIFIASRATPLSAAAYGTQRPLLSRSCGAASTVIQTGGAAPLTTRGSKKCFSRASRPAQGPTRCLRLLRAKIKATLSKFALWWVQTRPFTGTNRRQGYEATHRDIELLKLKNYTVGTKIDADILTGEDAQDKVRELFEGLESFVGTTFEVAMPANV